VVFYYPILWMPQWPLWPPLDIYVVAAALMHAGYEVVIIDERADPEPRAWLQNELKDALFVGLTGKMGYQMGNSLEAAQFVKSVRPDCPVVMGGWFPSLFPEQTMTCEDIDVAVEGPGDFNIVPIADGLLEKKSLKGIVGVWSRENGEIVKTPFTALPKLDETAEIPWDVLGIQRYIHPHGWINYYSSRGCPGACTFCAVFCLQPHGWTPLSADRVVNEIDYLVNKIGAKALKIVDTDFLASTTRIMEICRQLLERKITVRFEGLGRYATMNKMTVEQIRLLRTAGCTEIEMGIESGAQRLCDMIQKNVALEDVLDLVKRFVDNGIKMKLNFMFAIPSETKKDLIQTFRMIDAVKRLGRKVRLQLFRYTPLPDAPMNRQVWEQDSRGHQKKTSWSLDDLVNLPINDMPTKMHWISERHERDVKRAFNFYAPLAFYDTISDWARERPIQRTYLKLLRPLARWRTTHGFYAFPIEMWVNNRFGLELPRGEDDGVTPPDDVLPPPKFMGDTLGPEPD